MSVEGESWGNAGGNWIGIRYLSVIHANQYQFDVHSLAFSHVCLLANEFIGKIHNPFWIRTLQTARNRKVSTGPLSRSRASLTVIFALSLHCTLRWQNETLARLLTFRMGELII